MRTLAFGVSAALAPAASPLFADSLSVPQTSGDRAIAMPTSPSASNTWTVKNCNDSGPGSLRDIIDPIDPMQMHAKSGDLIDLSELPTKCGMSNSKITLGGEIVVTQDDLSLVGPTVGTVTISGAGKFRVFRHTGFGALALSGLEVSKGYTHAAGGVGGGCIDSENGDLSLSHVIVSSCIAASDTSYAIGGGVNAESGNVTLIASKITGNETRSGVDLAWGGGVYSRETTFAWYSSISGNTAEAGIGGGVVAASATMQNTTVDNNSSNFGGGIKVLYGPLQIIDSTISHNVASVRGGAIDYFAEDKVATDDSRDTTSTGSTVAIVNSTLAFNKTSASSSAAIYFHAFANSYELRLESSIIAKNTSGPANTPADILIAPGMGTLAGANNLVMASNVSNPSVITAMADPKLGPLLFNGGPTQTHMLLRGSPALGKGNTNALPANITTDQRGSGYPRKHGPGAVVDMGAVQFDGIFADSFNWSF